MGLFSSIVLAISAAWFGAWLQRRHWLLNLAEEIRMRETKELSSIADLISSSVDKRIAVQRQLLFSVLRNDFDKRYIDGYRSAIVSYSENYNTIRAKLNFYLSYDRVIYFEEEVNNRLVSNGDRIVALYKSSLTGSRSDFFQDELHALNMGLSAISADVYRLCDSVYQSISEGDFGTSRHVNNWKDEKNIHYTSVKLAKKIFNI